ncbi:kallikrein-11 isoform X3 [Pipistrellus kuhlii]|uniref:kallikrein-11 isoform X3 n=1 Tax=Pipistrellus kuhlii TaxID=59472 RepID=UPI00174EEB80|nr:kallikrein-11 isoform X3 [Pipistrellus kuhlii]
MKKLSLAGVESPVPRQRAKPEAEPRSGARAGCWQHPGLPGNPAPHLVRGAGRARQEADRPDKHKPRDVGDCLSTLPTWKPRWLGSGKASDPGHTARHVGGETRIIKGYECPPHSQPWQVVLYQKTRMLCGATLVAPKWLLTAAHCLKPQYIVHLGMHSLQRHDGWEQTRRATESFPHPDFNNSVPNKDHRNDIMLVKMASPVVITWAVRPLRLSSRCVAPGTRCLISGWGTTSSPQLHLPHSLRCANITIIDHRECENAYSGNITDTMVCASVREEGKDSCQGDSGGPLVCNGSLQGIISWGQDPCAVSRKPGVYTKVCKYVDWIHETMKNN